MSPTRSPGSTTRRASRSSCVPVGSVRTGPAPRANTVGGISMRFRTQLAVTGLVVSALAVGSLLGGVLGDGGRSAAATATAVPVDASFAADRALTGIAAAGGTDTR